MKITWLGHASFRIEIGGQVLLVDPWLEGNPMLPEDRWDEAVTGATAILITHGHGDHASSAAGLSKRLGVAVACIHELAEGYFASEGAEVIGFGKGGTISFGEVKVTMVNAVHSSSVDFKGQMQPAGSEAGFMIAGEGHTIYLTGDTDLMADMEWMAEYHKPDIGILCAGGHFTMDMDRAAFAAKKYFDFTTVIPCHYRTFPLLEQSADRLVAALPDVDVRTPEVMETLEI
jgi:L-ascorbate metabolism protein UlaG (beta-lactamase superfamily)